jgi:hypothetical protein
MNAENHPRSRRETPRWWVLYLILLSAAIVLWFGARARISARGHEALLVLTLFLVFALIEIWGFSGTLALLRAPLLEGSFGRIAPPGRLARARRSVCPAPNCSPVSGALLESFEPKLDPDRADDLPADSEQAWRRDVSRQEAVGPGGE